MVRMKKRMLLGMLLGLMVAGLANSWAAEEDSGKKARQFTGIVQAVTSGSIEVAKKKGGQTFSLTEATRYRDAEGNTIEKNALKMGNKVTVRYREADGGTNTAVSIQLK